MVQAIQVNLSVSNNHNQYFALDFCHQFGQLDHHSADSGASTSEWLYDLILYNAPTLLCETELKLR